MHGLTRLPAALILTDRIVDDAGLFPPEKLDMASALVRHRTDQTISKPVLSQRFVCPAGRFDELHQQLDDGDRIQVIALGPAAPQTQARVVSLEADDRTHVAALETSLPVDNQHKEQALEVIDQIAAARPHLDIFVEVGLGPALEADLDLLQRHGHAAKVRCGGVRGELFPLPSDLARFVHHAIGREVPFKATAGLHHAIAHHDGYTGFDHFGFLNLLLAVAAAQKGAGTNEVEHILAERNPNVVLEGITGLTTHDAGEIRAAFHSVGSCSTSEPIDDPRRLGLIADPTYSDDLKEEKYVMTDYLSGFGNGFESEALPGALPVGRNSPQQCAYGLYAEQLSGSPFTAPRASNERSWLYRIRPSVAHWGHFTPVATDVGSPTDRAAYWRSAPDDAPPVPIAQMRWNALPMPNPTVEKTTFITGVRTITTGGDINTHTGFACSIYSITSSMVDAYFYNGDAEMLFVLEHGNVRFYTEFGIIDAEPSEIVVIPRGVKLRVEVPDGPARGYLCENYGGSFTLPERGPIGANCLANPRDFLTPVAAYEDREVASTLYVKWGGVLWQTELGHSPLDVVAWHGNYAPYKYDMRRFSPVGPLLFDHADPSIFTVLTSPSETPGTANIDFVCFPERWMVAEDTFRPPWYHMNIMSEFMGLVHGVYDAKPDGFVPGGFSLHNCMTPHGPDANAFEAGSTEELKPVKQENTLAFMFETRFPQKITTYAADLPQRQKDYADCWSGLTKRFHADKR